MNHRISRILYTAMALVGALAAILGILTECAAEAVVGVVLILLGGVQALIFHRCPHCGHLLRLRGFRSKYCPACGGKLDV